MAKELLPGMDLERAKLLKGEIGKVRCWLTGFEAGRTAPGTVNVLAMPPGVDALRQIQIILDDAIRKQELK